MSHPGNDTELSHQQNADIIRLDLKRMARGIRGFALLTAERRRRVVVSGHVDDDYLRRIAGLLDHHPDLAAIAGLSSDEIHEHLRFTGAYQGVGRELVLHGHTMTDTIINERSSIGQRALRVHQIARTLNHRAEGTSVIPHLEALDRDYTRGRRRRRAKAEEGTPAETEEQGEM
jgi:hypothetical protein